MPGSESGSGQQVRVPVAVSWVLEERGADEHNDVMPDYGAFAQFYDAVMGVRTGSARVRERIEQYMPRASSLLELGAARARSSPVYHRCPV